jgi:hypothetical protein
VKGHGKLGEGAGITALPSQPSTTRHRKTNRDGPASRGAPMRISLSTAPRFSLAFPGPYSLSVHPFPDPLQFRLFVLLPLVSLWIAAAFCSLAFLFRVDTKEFGEAWEAAVFGDWQACQWWFLRRSQGFVERIRLEPGRSEGRRRSLVRVVRCSLGFIRTVGTVLGVFDCGDEGFQGFR